MQPSHHDYDLLPGLSWRGPVAKERVVVADLSVFILILELWQPAPAVVRSQEQSPESGVESRWLLLVIGQYSYSIYLLHIPVQLAIQALFIKVLGHEPHFVIIATCYLFGSLILGIAFARLIELPMLNLRDRLFPSRS